MAYLRLITIVLMFEAVTAAAVGLGIYLGVAMFPFSPGGSAAQPSGLHATIPLYMPALSDLKIPYTLFPPGKQEWGGAAGLASAVMLVLQSFVRGMYLGGIKGWVQSRAAVPLIACGRKYLLPEELSKDFLRHASGENLTVLERALPANETELYVLGGVELAANGPGRMGYVAYLPEKETWVIFEAWGKPGFHDLDSDGIDEFVVEFPGLHLHPANVVLFSFPQGGQFASAEVVSDQLAGKGRIFATLGRNMQDTVIDIGFVEDGVAAQRYRYENGTLVALD